MPVVLVNIGRGPIRDGVRDGLTDLLELARDGVSLEGDRSQVGALELEELARFGVVGRVCVPLGDGDRGAARVALELPAPPIEVARVRGSHRAPRFALELVTLAVASSRAMTPRTTAAMVRPWAAAYRRHARSSPSVNFNCNRAAKGSAPRGLFARCAVRAPRVAAGIGTSNALPSSCCTVIVFALAFMGSPLGRPYGADRGVPDRYAPVNAGPWDLEDENEDELEDLEDELEDLEDEDELEDLEDEDELEDLEDEDELEDLEDEDELEPPPADPLAILDGPDAWAWERGQ